MFKIPGVDQMLGAAAALFLLSSLLFGAAAYMCHSRWQSEKTAHAVTKAALASAQDAGKACSDGVANLDKKADAQHAEAMDAIRAARAASIGAQSRAQQILTQQPKFLDDLCKSAQLATDEWLLQRRGAK